MNELEIAKNLFDQIGMAVKDNMWIFGVIVGAILIKEFASNFANSILIRVMMMINQSIYSSTGSVHVIDEDEWILTKIAFTYVIFHKKHPTKQDVGGNGKNCYRNVYIRMPIHKYWFNFIKYKQ